MPYVVHPLQVGLLLAGHGFGPEVVAAGILHDVVEDSDFTVADLARDFEPAVMAIVAEVSEDKSLPWEARKQRTIDAIATMSEAARAVTAADKVHNLSDLSRLLARQGAPAWNLFRRGREPTLRYYEQVHAGLARAFPHPLTDELGELVAAIRAA